MSIFKEFHAESGPVTVNVSQVVLISPEGAGTRMYLAGGVQIYNGKQVMWEYDLVEPYEFVRDTLIDAMIQSSIDAFEQIGREMKELSGSILDRFDDDEDISPNWTPQIDVSGCNDDDEDDDESDSEEEVDWASFEDPPHKRD